MSTDEKDTMATAPPRMDLPTSDRIARVAAQATAWTGQLIDLGGRNNLLFYKDLKRGTLDLGEADERAFADLLAGKTVSLSRLVGGDALRDAVLRVRSIRNKAQEHREERGLETLFLACGMCTWESSTSSATPQAPLLLRQLTIQSKGAAQDDFELALTGDAEVNPTLMHLLDADFGRKVDPEGLMNRMDGAIDTPAELDEAYRWLEDEVRGVPGFAVAPRRLVGTFSYAKLPMVKDLEGATDALAAHPIVAALSGDEDARAELRARNGAGEVHASDPDRTAPADEFLVLDADASQNHVINAVLAGRDLIVKGPPGTGKSQTIANLVATLIARGRRVLFVAEKRAAIDAVLGRLERVGLQDLVMDLHGSETRRSIAQGIGRALLMSGQTPAIDRATDDNLLVRRRSDLGRYREALHQKRDPWGFSVYEAEARCLGTSAAARTGVRLAAPALEAMNPRVFEEAVEDVRRYVGLGGLDLASGASPWSGSAVTSEDEARRAQELIIRLHQESLPAARAAMERAAGGAQHEPPPTLDLWEQRIALYEQTAATLEVLGPEAFAPPAKELLDRLAPLAKGGLGRALAGITNSDFRAARRELAGLARHEGADPAELHPALVAAQELGVSWRELRPDGEARALPELERLQTLHAALVADLEQLDAVLPGRSFARMSSAELHAALGELRADQTLARLPELHRLRARLSNRGLTDLLGDCATERRGVEDAVASLGFAVAASVLDRIGLDDPRIGTFEGDQHRRAVEQFRDADRDHIAATAARVRRRSAEEIVRAREEYPDEAAVLERQAALKRKHLPLRQLVQAAPNVLLALKPCWAMSPLMVSQVLPSERPYFDVVVFDEASQVLPADAVPAILRGRQLVVAGDDKQLPPTTFFAAQSREEEDVDPDDLLAGTAGFESILDALASHLPPRTLEWHYRSQDERLIAFSNAHLYDRMLTTFPGVGGEEDCVRHELVPYQSGQPGSEESGAAEVRRVVELMLDHARRRPDESLGVIAMGIKHAERIEETLRRALREHPELEEFFSDAQDERPFVKNLERVQGDERDAIILTIGYGKDATGRLLYRFGPLNQEGGERRLNVAVTRARKRITLVSSFGSADMDPDRSSARGVELLRLYLEYAESRGTNLGRAAIETPALNPFEVDVKAALESAGIAVDAQVGCSGFRIDFAARHPRQPGRHVLAIECDGASYHSSPTARDRDRLRQEHLERLGWRFHRIWSPEWFHHRDAALAKVIDAYRAAVEAADREPPPAPPAPEAPATIVVAAPEPAPVGPDRGPKPVWIRPGQPIDSYNQRQLVELIRWIRSDTLLRTTDELIAEGIAALGFKRRGSRIVAALEQAIRQADRRRPAA